MGLLYDGTAAVGVYEGASVITGRMIDALGAGLPAAEVEAAVLPGLQEAHWAIHRAFAEHQRIAEDRRHLAAEIGELIAGLVSELIAGLVSELVAAGWSEQDARQADVRQLADAPAR